MLTLILYTGFILSLSISVLVMPIIIRITEKKGLMENNDYRKIHTEKVSTLGGIGIFSAFLLAVLPAVSAGYYKALLVPVMAMPLLITGVLDDLYNVSVRKRLMLQIALGVVLYGMGLKMYLPGMPWGIELFATVFFTVAVINAYNLIDGINGLAGGLGAIGSFSFGVWFLLHGSAEMAYLAFALTGALAGFLSFNFGKKAKIFMGDNGSTVVGFSLAVMILEAIQTDMGTSAYLPNLVWAVICIPMVDAFKVAAFRMIRKQSPFYGDRTHIHHLLTDSLLTHPVACLVLYGLEILLIGASFFYQESFWIFVALSIPVPYLVAGLIRRSPLTASEPVSA